MSMIDVPTATKGHNKITDALAEARERFIAANPKSRGRWENARAVMPGGNTRTVLHYDPFPLTMVKGEGAYLTDLDGHGYTDFLNEYSAGLYGHSNPVILAAIKKALDGGIVLGAPNQWEVKLAELVTARFPSIDQVRFTNSGTEANLMALGAARAFTKRDKIMVFDGAYHGGVLYFAHRGMPVNVPFDVVYGTFNSTEESLAVLNAHAHELAAVIVEPMVGGGGCLPADREFLDALRGAAKRHGIVLIFDEVMTSRSSAGGLQQRLGVIPDMTTLGKYLGGGSSFGAFGGRSDIMAQFDPTAPGAMPHAGTFNNNVMSMAAGYAGLSEIFTAAEADSLYDRGEAFKARLNAIIAACGVEMQITGSGSILGLHCVTHPIRAPHDIKDARPDIKTLIHLEMMMRGFSYAQRGYMTLSLAMTDQDLDGFATAFEDVLRQHGDIL